MIVFPQLSTGASGQYPISKRWTARTIRNVCPDGHEIRLADPGAVTVEWQLRLGELTDEEITAIRDFFDAVEGRLSDFTFLDPTDNLLLWSETLDDATWQKDPLLQVTGGVEDPFSTNRGFRISNPSGAPLRMQQRLNVPAWFHYSLSLYTRGDAVTLLRAGQSRVYQGDSMWRRLVFSGKAESTEEFAWFGLEVGAGASVDAFGLQVEAQIGASGYKKTTSSSGVYAGARLRDDALALTAQGPGRHSCLINVIHANHI